MTTTYGPLNRREILLLKEGDVILKKVPKLEYTPISGKCYQEIINYFWKVILKFEIVPQIAGQPKVEI